MMSLFKRKKAGEEANTIPEAMDDITQTLLIPVKDEGEKTMCADAYETSQAEIASYTSIGTRKSQQDSICFDFGDFCTVCAVCDGMGGLTGGDRCAVFEGFMDFLSYLQYAREHPGLPPMNFCILNSTAMAGRSGEFLSRHRLVHAFLDNDKAGMDALEKLEGNLGKDTVLVNESVRLYPRHNDFNEFLQACKKKAMTAGNEM